MSFCNVKFCSQLVTEASVAVSRETICKLRDEGSKYIIEFVIKSKKLTIFDLLKCGNIFLN